MSWVMLTGSLAAIRSGAGATPTGIHEIQHVIVVMQENRSFDKYFGCWQYRYERTHHRHCPELRPL